ncbi:MAG: hypothetical protein QXD55_01850 [Candidatus Aenigmatarchaeota archaeon]
MKKTEKNFLGGIFRFPELKELKNKLKEKFGYMPRDKYLDYFFPVNEYSV